MNTPTRPPEPMHADLYALHSQIVQCRAEGFPVLADVLDRTLARQMRERGVEALNPEAKAQDERLPMSGAALDLFTLFAPSGPAQGVKTPGNGLETPALGRSVDDLLAEAHKAQAEAEAAISQIKPVGRPIKVCPECCSPEITHRHHRGPIPPECFYDECDACGHQFNQT